MLLHILEQSLITKSNLHNRYIELSVMSTINIICIHTSYAVVMFTMCGIKWILFYAYSRCRCLVLVKWPLCPLLCCWWQCLLYSCASNPWLYFDDSCLVAGLLSRGQGPEGPATGHLDAGFSWFPCVHEQMLRWSPRCEVATTCFSCSLPRPKSSSKSCIYVN